MGSVNDANNWQTLSEHSGVNQQEGGEEKNNTDHAREHEGYHV